MDAVTYDRDADALYVRLAEGYSARQQQYGDLRIVDLADDGTVLGIEFIDVSGGVDLRDLPFAQTVERLIHDSGQPVRLLAA